MSIAFENFKVAVDRLVRFRFEGSRARNLYKQRQLNTAALEAARTASGGNPSRYKMALAYMHYRDARGQFDALGALRFPSGASEQVDADLEALTDMPLVGAGCEFDGVATGIAHGNDNWAVAAGGSDGEEVVIIAVDDVCSCEECGGSFTESHAFTNVRTRYGTDSWCTNCTGEDAFYCDETDTYYNSRYFTTVNTPSGTGCREALEDDGDWHFYTAHGSSHACPADEAHEYDPNYEYDDDDDDDGDGGRDGTIPSYHNGDRAQIHHHVKRASTSLRAFYGIELEVEFPDFDRRHSFYRDGHLNGWGFAEHDGSLSESRGLEIVVRPYTYDDLASPENPLAKLLRTLTYVYDVDEPSDRCGIHITVNTHRLPHDVRERFQRAVNHFHRLSELVAMRRGNSYCEYNAEHTGKHIAVHDRFDDGRALEVRIFQSTLKHYQLLSYVEFLAAIEDWVMDPNRPIRGPLATAMFRQYVVSKAGAYPHLASRFARVATTPEESVECA